MDEDNEKRDVSGHFGNMDSGEVMEADQQPQFLNNDSTDDLPDNNVEPSQLTQRRKIERDKSRDGDVETEFACSVCLLLSALPTTLICGHTSCRYCLAQWYFSSKKKECPLCKAPYQGHPKVNTQLRNMLTRLYPVAMRERDEEAESDSIKSVIANYDAEMSKETKTQTQKSDVTSFFSGIIVAACIFVVLYLAWYWKSHDDNLLVKKPVTIWTPRDVETWLNEISWGGQYAHLAQEKLIDGRLLLSINEDDLIKIFNISEVSHAKALMLLIVDLHETGLKMPANLWEYKAIYPGRCLFLVYGLKDFPRTTILYLWMYFREEMFYPFVIATQEDEDQIMSQLQTLNNTEMSNTIQPSRRAFYGFLYYTIFMPEYLIGVFAYNMFRHHFFTPFVVLTTVVCRLILEVQKLNDIIRNGSRRMVFQMCKQHAKHLVSAFMFMVLWPLIPNFICDVFFYCALYVSPIQMLSTVFTKLRQRQP